MTAGWFVKSRSAALLLAAFACLACERAQERTAEHVVERMLAKNGRKAKVEFDRSRGSITVDLGGVVKPKDWPPSVPIPPSAIRARVDSKTADGWRLGVTSPDRVADLAGSYRSDLAAAGWTLEPAMAEGGPIHASRGDRHLVARFSESADGSRSRIAIEVAPRS